MLCRNSNPKHSQSNHSQEKSIFHNNKKINQETLWIIRKGKDILQFKAFNCLCLMFVVFVLRADFKWNKWFIAEESALHLHSFHEPTFLRKQIHINMRRNFQQQHQSRSSSHDRLNSRVSNLYYFLLSFAFIVFQAIERKTIARNQREWMHNPETTFSYTYDVDFIHTVWPD